MRFGVFDHVDDAGIAVGRQLAERLELAERLDAAGFHAYHIAEHHGTPLGYAASPNVFLAAVAQRTTRLRFGPLVYVLPLYHPLRLIEEVCLLDQLSGGRLEVGVGHGASFIESALYGVEPET
jgi:alkanesulfonate monooxygenase SsuD/methylene tetrahydromethanopterin reductase-like flavin-dependent oxidoreductase (luciferase family)